MKKLLVKIVSLITATILSIGLFSGCDLVTTDVERDMNQIIAEVSIPDSGLKDTIYKRELSASFNSTGYYYVMYYGYGLSETYQMLLDELIDSRIIVQQSRLALTGKSTSGGVVLNDEGFFKKAYEVAEDEKTSKDRVLSTDNHNGKKMTELKKDSPLDEFLTDYEYAYAQYNLVLTLDSLLASYRDEEEEKEYKYENISVTDRTTLTIPTEETKNEDEKKTQEVSKSYAKSINKINKDNDLGLKIFNEDGSIAYSNVYDLDWDLYTTYVDKYDISTKENKRAVKKLIKNLKDYGFISSEEASRATPTELDKLFELTYFKDSVKALYENLLVTKYKLALENQQEKLVNKDTLYSEYVTLFNSQKELYKNNYEAYETALEGAGESTFVVYNPNYGKGSYGYIANLLIGFSEQQKSRLDTKMAEANITDAEVKAFRQALINELLVYDLRESWVMSNHGSYSPETGKFTFDGDYCPTELLREFNGTILGATPYQYLDENGEEATKYTYKSVQAGAISYEDFYKNVFANVMGITDIKNTGKIEGVELINSISKRVNDETLKKFRDLIYAYSTDAGSLAENYGYVYSPITSGKVGPFSGKYVEEYAEASKRLIEGGVGSYEAVVSDYGVHILLCTSVILPSGEAPVSFDAFNADLLVEGTLAYMFKEYKLSLISSTQINSITDSFINQNRAKGVTLYEDRYSDLITEEEEEDDGHNH